MIDKEKLQQRANLLITEQNLILRFLQNKEEIEKMVQEIGTPATPVPGGADSDGN